MTGTALRSTALTVLVGILITVCGMNGTAFSTAAFTTTTVNPVSTASAAVDWTPPTTSVVEPTAPLRGTATVTANAADAETGIRDVVVEAQIGGAWTALCIDTTAPYSCAWNTTAVADGSYGLRAVATDRTGLTTTSAMVMANVTNSLAIVFTNPGEVLTGSVPLHASMLNSSEFALTMRFEYSPAGSGNWSSAGSCIKLLGATECSDTWSTTGLFSSVPSGTYDLRAVASKLGTVVATSAVYTDVILDNTAPTATMVDPGTPLSGTVALAANASDAHSGVESVAIEYARSGSSTWTTVCTSTSAPYSCRLNTTTLSAGTYIFRAIATDIAGNRTISASTAGRMVDNTISSVSLNDIAPYLSGTATLSADASSTAGITSVTLQYAPSGSSTWTTICVLTTAPYSCPWNTAALADGRYSVRAVLLDKSGKTTISTAVTERQIDNTPVRGLDVQTANSTGIVGRLDSGDTIRFTYSKPMAPGSIRAGWNGSATAVTVRLRDGALTGTGSASDTLDVLAGGSPIALGTVNLRGDYIKTNKSATVNATMTATTTTVNGQQVTVVSISVGTLASGGALRTATAPGAMLWSPSSGATDLSGVACSTAPVTETGASDREF